MTEGKWLGAFETSWKAHRFKVLYSFDRELLIFFTIAGYRIPGLASENWRFMLFSVSISMNYFVICDPILSFFRKKEIVYVFFFSFLVLFTYYFEIVLFKPWVMSLLSFLTLALIFQPGSCRDSWTFLETPPKVGEIKGGSAFFRNQILLFCLGFSSWMCFVVCKIGYFFSFKYVLRLAIWLVKDFPMYVLNYLVVLIGISQKPFFLLIKMFGLHSIERFKSLSNEPMLSLMEFCCLHKTWYANGAKRSENGGSKLTIHLYLFLHYYYINNFFFFGMWMHGTKVILLKL